MLATLSSGLQISLYSCPLTEEKPLVVQADTEECSAALQIKGPRVWHLNKGRRLQGKKSKTFFNTSSGYLVLSQFYKILLLEIE